MEVKREIVKELEEDWRNDLYDKDPGGVIILCPAMPEGGAGVDDVGEIFEPYVKKWAKRVGMDSHDLRERAEDGDRRARWAMNMARREFLNDYERVVLVADEEVLEKRVEEIRRELDSKGLMGDIIPYRVREVYRPKSR